MMLIVRRRARPPVFFFRQLCELIGHVLARAHARVATGRQQRSREEVLLSKSSCEWSNPNWIVRAIRNRSMYS